MTATSPTPEQQAAAILDALLTSLPPSHGAREARLRSSLKAAQRALSRDASTAVALDAAERSYRRH